MTTDPNFQRLSRELINLMAPEYQDCTGIRLVKVTKKHLYLMATVFRIKRELIEIRDALNSLLISEDENILNPSNLYRIYWVSKELINLTAPEYKDFILLPLVKLTEDHLCLMTILYKTKEDLIEIRDKLNDFLERLEAATEEQDVTFEFFDKFAE